MMGIPDQIPCYLPRSILDLIDVIGEKATQIIVNERGGITLCVPSTVTEDHWLYSDIGKEAFTKLVKTYKGEEIEIARCEKALQLKKELDIVKAKSQGIGTFTLARHYQLSARRIRMIVEKHRNQQPSNQTELF